MSFPELRQFVLLGQAPEKEIGKQGYKYSIHLGRLGQALGGKLVKEVVIADCQEVEALCNRDSLGYCYWLEVLEWLDFTPRGSKTQTDSTRVIESFQLVVRLKGYVELGEEGELFNQL